MRDENGSDTSASSPNRWARRPIEDPRVARRWIVAEAVVIVAALVAVAVTWSRSSVDTDMQVFATVIAFVIVGRSLWEIRSLWPVAGRAPASRSTGSRVDT